jgi:putative transposase
MRFRLIDEEKTYHPISRLARTLGVSAAGYHAWSNRPPSRHKVYDEILKEKIEKIHKESFGIYGAPRIHAELADTYSIRIAKKRVARLMSELGIQGVSRRGKRRAAKSTAETPAAPDLVKRNFSSKRPNELWVADISVPQQAA